MKTATATRTDLDTLRDCLAWISDSYLCINLDPEQLAEELKRIIEKQERNER